MVKQCMTILTVRTLTHGGLVKLDDVQSACLTKVTSMSRSNFKVKHTIVSAIYLLKT